MNTKTQNPLVGTWKTVSFEIKRSNGEIHKPFGDHPDGQMVYTDNDRFSAQLAQPGRLQIKSGDMMDTSHEELTSNYRGFISYYGHYTYDAKSNTVLHHIEGSLFPNWENDTLKRFVKATKDKIELTTEPTFYGGEEIVASVTWKRIK
jgi:hypothetical protein